MCVAVAVGERSGVCEHEGQGAEGRLIVQRIREHRGHSGA